MEMSGAGVPAARCARWRPAGFLALVCLSLSVAAGGMAAIIPGAAPGGAFGGHRNALWRVVHDLCAVDRRVLGLPAPCLAVNLREGWAVVKDTEQPTHILLVPTRRVSGIESPALLAPDAPNYWAQAWNARAWFERLVGRPVPRGDFALVINSRFGRTQDQLHIHIDCLWPPVVAALDASKATVGAAWATLDAPLLGKPYEARRIDGEDLVRNPFKLLARGDERARDDMGAYTLAAIPEVFADGKPGFILLARHADFAHGDPAAAEGLLDHRCSVLRAAAGPA